MDWAEIAQEAAALGAAAVLGGLLGLEREVKRRWAGLRTHMLVAVGTCLFMLVGVVAGDAGSRAAVLSRVMQGIAAGIGFIGAGTILKLTEQLEVKGLTTASSIWTAAALGTACGIHRYDLAVLGTAVALLILLGVRPIERWCSPHPPSPPPDQDQPAPRGSQRRRRKQRQSEGLDKQARGQN